MHDIQGHVAGHNAFMDETTNSPSLLSVLGDRAARLFLVGPGGEQVDSS